MYYCENCENTFSEPDTYEERHPYGMGYASETFACCPYCSFISFEEAKRCEHCDEWFGESILMEGLCPECYEDMYGKED